MVMNILVFGGAEVATEEERLNPLQKSRISRHYVFKLPVLRAVLSHHYLAVSFENLRLKLTWMLMHQGFQRNLTRDNRIADFFYTGRTETVCLAWKTKRWRAAFV